MKPLQTSSMDQQIPSLKGICEILVLGVRWRLRVVLKYRLSARRRMEEMVQVAEQAAGAHRHTPSCALYPVPALRRAIR